ncbi:MAG TPA: hypothetical protein VGN63_12225 [Flavisolibacter sp.]|jgi:hypothetical protein|nr:hypothetical protein [Flavisolibacter sp.]
MFTYQKFLIKGTDRFDPASFPQLNTCLRQTINQLATAPAGPSTAMIVSFTKYHAINSQQVQDHPQLASQISEKELPLNVLEQLFEASRHNPAFQRDLEDYVVTCLTKGEVVHPGL